MDTIKLSVLERAEKGNGPSRRLRAAGRIPGIVYGKGTSAIPVSIEFDSLRAALANGQNVVMELDFVGQDGVSKKITDKSECQYVVVKDMQFHPITRRKLLHVDLYEVDLSVEIEASVPLELIGTAAGIADGGIVDWVCREVTVRALPNNIPTSIELDISELLIGQNLTVSAIVAPDGVTIAGDPEVMVVSVAAPRMQEEEAVESEEGEVLEPKVVGETSAEE